MRGRAVVACVSPAPQASVLVASTAFTGALWDYATVDQIATDQAEQLRNQVERYAADHAVDLTFVHARGDATIELLRVAAAHHADLIVVGRSAKARHYLAGSLGRRLIGNRKAPVIVVVP